MADPADLTHGFAGDSVSRALELVGERCTLLILREAFFGVRRYGQFASNLGSPRPTLPARLRKLVDADLLDRVVYASNPDRYEYRPTEAGRALFPSILTMTSWGDTYVASHDGPPITLRHATRGQDTHPRLTCDVCGEAITTRNVEARRGPGYVATEPPRIVADNAGELAREV